MRTLLLAGSLLVAAPLAAQSDIPAPPVRDSIVAVVKQLFDGMRAHDSTMIRSAFVEGAVMMGPAPQPGRPQVVQFSSIDGFVGAAGRPGVPWDEQIFDPEIRIDGGLATMWIFYTFHAGERFSHCGYDALFLVRTEAGWKIAAIADTRRQEGCDTAGKEKV